MQKFENAVIFAASDITNTLYTKEDGDLVIAADLGYKNACDMGVYPDRVVGDFDSLGNIPEHESLTKLPVEKDDTDTSFAVKSALENGAKSIFILGGMGGRLDHTFANIQLLSYIARRGAHGYLINRGEMLTVIKDSTAQIHGKIGETVSVFSTTDNSTGVYERGFKYTLTDAVLENGFALGVSNELSSNTGEITVKDGELLIAAQEVSSDFIAKNRHESACINGLFNIYLQ